MAITVYEKRIRDPILGDIGLHEEELEIIDTRQFQNLRGIKQLGLAYLVYPSATHTRFEHALGTLHMAQCIIEGVNLNSKRRGSPEIGDEEIPIVRLAALLHDISHAPFGHTIEDDLRLRTGHDKSARLDQSLNEETEVGRILQRAKHLEHVKRILAANDEEDIKALGKHKLEPKIAPYMADIISNTICADLLDYVRRDTYFTGIRFAFDDRILDHFEIDRENRLAIRAVHMGRYRTAVMSEILNILRARYTLAERLIYHHANQAVVAMLGRALLEKPEYSLSLVEDETDFEFLSRLEKSGGEIARKLTEKIRRRGFHKQVYVATRAEAEAHGGVGKIVKAYGRNPAARLHLASALEKALKIDPGSVIIHCPAKEDMSLKEARVRVLLKDDDVQVLADILQDPPKGEVDELNQKHRALWSFQAFLAAEHAENAELRSKASDLLEKKLRLHNELYAGEEIPWDYLGMLEESYDEIGKEADLDLGGLNSLKLRSYEEMRKFIHKAIRDGDTLSVEILSEELRKFL